MFLFFTNSSQTGTFGKNWVTYVFFSFFQNWLKSVRVDFEKILIFFFFSLMEATQNFELLPTIEIRKRDMSTMCLQTKFDWNQSTLISSNKQKCQTYRIHRLHSKNHLFGQREPQNVYIGKTYSGYQNTLKHFPKLVHIFSKHPV